MRAALAGDVPQVRELNARLARLNKALFVEANPIPVKWALAQMGRSELGYRLPLVELGAQHHETVRRAPGSGPALNIVRISMNKRHAGLSALMSLVLLAGCSEVNQFLGKEESVNYKSAVSQRGEPLSIPPDLTQAASDPLSRAGVRLDHLFAVPATRADPGHRAQVHQCAARPPGHARRARRRPALAGHQPSARRHLPRVVDFWTESGFTIQSNNPKAGLIETDWAENRAKIPESWLRQALGSAGTGLG